jgi:TonB family protein
MKILVLCLLLVFGTLRGSSPAGITVLIQVDPVYPEILYKNKIGGVAVFRVRVDENGSLNRYLLISKVHPLFDEESEKALKQWKWKPFLIEGKAVPFEYTVMFKFTPKERKPRTIVVRGSFVLSRLVLSEIRKYSFLFPRNDLETKS